MLSSRLFPNYINPIWGWEIRMGFFSKIAGLFSRSSREENLLLEGVEHAKAKRPEKALEIYNSLLATPTRASVSRRKRPVRLTSAHSYAPDSLFARSLTWTSYSRAGVVRDTPVALLAVLTVVRIEILLAWLNRVLPFDSYRYAFNAETLKALPRRGRTLALMFSGPSGVGLLPQSKCGSPSNKNIRAPCEAVALGTLAGKCEPHTRRISEKEH